MPNYSTVGSYCSVADLRAAANIQDSTRDAVILEHLLAASRDVEQSFRRRFFPVLATNYYDWPPPFAQSTAYTGQSQPLYVSGSDYYRWLQFDPTTTWWWRLYLNDDLLSASNVLAAATGLNTVPVTLTHYLLGPQAGGPPYKNLEIDLSNTDVLQAGSTPQRAISITGQWGYCNTTKPAGSLVGAITSGATTLVCSDRALIDQGDVLLVDAEAIFVDASAPGTTLTVQRGVNGTTAAAHSDAAPMVKYQAPAPVRRLVRADAISSFQLDLSAWARTVGAGDLATEWQGKALAALRKTVEAEYSRRKRQVVFA